MLLCLRVRNFAIIDELEVELEPGLNVVTGETGAGKSILVSALGLVLGDRGRPEIIRTGADSAEVEALFDVGDDERVRARLEALEVAADEELVLRRVVQRGGRSRAYVNGRMASASELGALAAGIADISSQHEHHSLTDPTTHLHYLDAFGRLNVSVAEATRTFEALRSAHNALKAQSQALQNRVEREDLLRYQVKEIEALAPKSGERAQLTEERDRQRHAERLATWTNSAEEALYSRDEAVCSELSRIAHSIEQASQFDASLSPMLEQLRSAQAQLEDVASELGRYARTVSLDPERLREIEERMEALDRALRKYGGSEDDVIAYGERAAAELLALEHGEAELIAKQKAFDEARTAALAAARKLSQERKKSAKKLGTAITSELASLFMGDAQVSVDVDSTHDSKDELAIDGMRLSPTGIDRVELLIATNRGEEPQPLRKIASGGELSRAMLAIKRVLAGLGPHGLYVFDEVDSGVGGAVAEVIGRKLKEVSKHHQVLCITHLPQIAVFADAHFQVRKSVAKDRTRSEIVRLTEAEQREEIARMLGGIKITDKTRAAAQEMLRAARD